VWGFSIVADSAQFSALVSEHSARTHVGTALTLQTSVGFLLTIASIRLLPWFAGLVGWQWAFPVLAVVWGGALAAIILKLCWVQAPKWLSAAIGLTLGWVGAIVFPQLLTLSTVAILLVAASGVLYTVGAVVYTRRRPDPRPQVFGYHELFHVLTVAAVACEYVVVAFYVLPRA